MYSNRFRRIKSVNFVVLLVRALCKGFPRFHTGKAVRTATPYNYNLSGGCRGGPGGGGWAPPPPPPPLFLDQTEEKKKISRLGIPLSPGSGWPPPPTSPPPPPLIWMSSMSGSATEPSGRSANSVKFSPRTRRRYGHSTGSVTGGCYKNR